MAHSLIPVWNTPADHLISVVETDDISISLQAYEELVLSMKAGDFLIELTEGASRVSEVLVAKTSVAFALDGENIVLTPLVTDAEVIVRTATSPYFRVLSGTLPPGLAMNGEGVISGRTGNLVGQPRRFDFTVRTWNDGFVRDRTFSIEVTGYYFPGHLNPRTLKGGKKNNELNFVYHPLTTLKRGDPYRLTLDILDPDGETPPVRVEMVAGLPESATMFGWMPPGIELKGSEIVGRISADAPAGEYYFTLVINDPVEASLTTFRIDILDDVASDIHVNTEIYWITPPGNLGTIKEAHRSLLGVEVEVLGFGEPIFSLAPGSGPLPPGLTLQPSGEITGVVGPITANTTYQFKIRATVDHTFIERIFSIFTTTFFNAVPYYDMKLRLNVMDRLNFMRPYRLTIPDGFVYRSSDVAVGIPVVPEIYLIKGLDARVSLDVLRSGRDETAADSDFYFKPIDLVLGEHRVAVDRDHNGKILCEVIYRIMYDYQDLAGGFSREGDRVVESPVVSPINNQVIYPVSLRNQRLEMVNRIGFATLDPTKKNLLGPRGLEVLPAWMRSQQVLGDPDSTLGFIPAIVVAYVKPGASNEVLSLISKQSYIPQTGKVYTFDRYYVAGGNRNYVQL